ncbi:MAG: hypothetical protein ACW96S_13740, partial [Promethearchaeota archaeon]
EEIDPLIDRLLGIAEKQQSYLYLAETKLFQAKLALIEMKFEQAQKLLTQAEEVAESHGLNLLAINISGEHDKLLDQIKNWEHLKETDAPLSERINLASIDGVMDSLQGKKTLDNLELTPESPVFLLIITGAGIPLFSFSFSQELTFQDDIISGFISAFNNFSGELFSKGLDRARFGDYIILMDSIKTYSICYLFKGQTYSAKQNLTHFVQVIQKNSTIWKTLENFHKTSQVLELKDVPQLGVIIKDIFNK